MTKILLIERAMMVSPGGTALNEATQGRGYIVEAATRPGVLCTVQLPVTTLDKQNENHRTYRRTIMETAMQRCRPEMESRSLLSSVMEHPEEPYVTPGLASHIVTEAWCENDGYLWNKWDVINTENGRNLNALIEARAAIGVSIRGLGSQDNLGNILEDYEYLGTDCVGQPSAKIRTAPTRVALVAAESTAAAAAGAMKNISLIQHQSAPGNTAMKTKDQATKFAHEQVLLMQAEGRMDATRRMIAAEDTLTTSGVGARDLQEAYSILDAHKAVLDNATPAAVAVAEAPTTTALQARVAELEATLTTQNRTFRTRVNAMAEKFRTNHVEMQQRATRAERAAKAYKNRYTEAVSRLTTVARARRESSQLGQMLNRDRLRLRQESTALRVRAHAATNLAVRAAVETRMAVREAALAVRALRQRPAAVVPVQEAVSRIAPRQQVGLVETTPVRTTKVRTDAKGIHQTAANRRGEVRQPGWM